MNNTSYTSNTIFENNQINAICDYMFTKLAEAFPPVPPDTNNDFLFKGIILSGVGAEIIQNPKVENLKNIIFQCDKQDIFDWLTVNFNKVFNCKGIAFKERIIFYPFGYYFEIWFSETALNPVEEENIFIQFIDDIPTILK